MSTLFSHFFTKFNQISPLEHDFTEVLGSIALVPKTLYFYGKLPQNVAKLRPKTVAIVGSRHNTRYGYEVAYKLAYELARHNVIVVSGLAYGIDSIAHRGCLDAGGTTIAVLGNSIDRIYPSAHTVLAREIVEKGGCVVSEYPPTATPITDVALVPGESIAKNGQRQVNYRTSFLYRNRLIAGLSDIIVVVEAAERSGSLNTATHALDQGKDVFAVPGNITSPYSQGCNKLLREGALVYTEPSDVLRELFPAEFANKERRKARQGLVGDNDVETRILRAIADGHRKADDIMAITHLPPEVFTQSVMVLELKTRLRSISGNEWTLS